MKITSSLNNLYHYQEVSNNKQKTASKTLDELSMDERALLNKLQARDSEVKAHEAAHKAVGGALAGSASYSYQKGPDGKMYAIGGEVPISMKEGQTPQETLTNARVIKAAALAPANPSAQDYAVASAATVMELKAQQEILKQTQAKLEAKKSYNTADQVL